MNIWVSGGKETETVVEIPANRSRSRGAQDRGASKERGVIRERRYSRECPKSESEPEPLEVMAHQARC